MLSSLPIKISKAPLISFFYLNRFFVKLDGVVVVLNAINLFV